MKEWQSLAHVRWECKYHLVFVPKYRRKVLYGRTRPQIGRILQQLCRQKGVEIFEGHTMPDHIHMILRIPPKFSVAMVVGYLKGKSAIQIHRQMLGVKRRFLERRHFSRNPKWGSSDFGFREKWRRSGLKHHQKFKVSSR